MSRRSYRAAGVDMELGERLTRVYAELAWPTLGPNVLGGVGGFAGLMALPDVDDGVLVTSCDGVGTKLELARSLGRLDGVGIDLVAMAVNDVLTVGAMPLFLLDCLSAARLDAAQATAIVASIAKGCAVAGCALLGGETAELPGVLRPGRVDLSAFAVGVVSRSRIVDGRSVVPGDVVLGLASSGPHANGYSLIRHVLRERSLSLDVAVRGESRTLGELLLAPTRIYVPAIRSLATALGADFPRAVHGLAHITGGGLATNLRRILPPGVNARLQRSWPVPPVFDVIRAAGRVDPEEMDRVFNLGVGFVLIVAPDAATDIQTRLAEAGERVTPIGTVQAGTGRVDLG